MSDDTKRYLIWAGIALLGALLGALVVWLVVGGQPEGPDERVAELEAEVASLAADADALETSLAAAQDELAATEGDAEEDAGSATSGESGSPGTGSSGSGSSTSSGTERQFCYVESVSWESGPPQITVDYAQFLTGEDAAEAAIAHGDEVFDFYIVNDNPRLRTFPADPDLRPRLTSKSGGLTGDPYEASFGEWFDSVAGMSPGWDFVTRVPYWITIEDGTIVAIEEQYIP